MVLDIFIFSCLIKIFKNKIPQVLIIFLLLVVVNINEYDKHSVRSLMGMVLQDSWLFSDTIANNIVMENWMRQMKK